MSGLPLLPPSTRSWLRRSRFLPAPLPFPLKSLPDGSVIINRPESFYEKHRYLVLGTLAVVSALTLMVILLTWAIIRRKRAEVALRKSEENYRNLYDEAPVGYAELDGDGRITRINKMELEILGYTAGEVLGQPIWRFVVEENLGNIGLLVTDVVMPEMNGRDLANLLRESHPDLKCLYMSGYTANVIAHHGVLDEGVLFVQKPFSIRDLAYKVREALDRG
jgi:PAS domain-containing protein